MSKRLMTMLAGVAALAILVAGCGGSDEEEPLTKAEYTKQGTAICQDTLADMKVAFRGLEEKEKAGSNQDELASEFVVTTMVPAYEAQLEELRDLPPPSADEEKLNAIYDEMQRGIERLKANAPKFFQLATRPLLKGRKEAQSYGLNGCMSIL